MKQIKGFKDGVYFYTWEDQQYNTKFWSIIVTSGDVNDVDVFIKKLTNEDWETLDKAHAMCWERFDPTGRQNIFLAFKHTTSAGTTVHEAIHAKNFVFRQHGVKPDLDNDEHEAYYMDYLFRKLLDSFREFDKASLKLKNKNKRHGRKN